MTEWKNLYGTQTKSVATLNMCGGCQDWWNYVIHFKDDITVYRQDCDGLHQLPNIDLIYHRDEEEIREEDSSTDYELKEDELLIDYDFFCWY